MGGLGQAAGHQGDHGPQDHGFVAGWEAFVVADGAAVLADPGEGPLHDPAAGKDLKRVRVALGDDLDIHPQGRGPSGELAGVCGIGPGQADPAAGTVQVPQQRPGGVAVLDGCGGDHHGQQQAHGIDGDVPFAAVDLLGVVPAPAGARHGVGGADGLGVDDRRGRLRVPPGGSPDLGAQRVVQPGQGAVIAPGGEVPVHGPPGREVGRQVPPGAPGPVHVQDGLHDPAGRPDAGPAPPAGNVCRQVRDDHLPLGVGQVTGIAPGLRSGPARTLSTRGPCLSGRHTSGSWGPRPFISTGRHAANPGQARHDRSPDHLSNTH
jgi:hypothetical protein